MAPSCQFMSADYKVPPPLQAEPPTAASADPDAADLPCSADVETRESLVGQALHGQRLDKALVAIASEFSRSHLQTLVALGHVRLDGERAGSASRKVLAGQLLVVDLVPTAESRAFCAESLPLHILHEDEHLLVLDKPAGRVVHPAAGNWSGTLLNGLLAYHPAAARLPRAGIVHRLDKDTSGLMVVGKTLPAVTALVRAIAAREVHRHYLAIVHGALASAAFSVDAPIGRDPQSRIRMAVLQSGKAARTDFEPVASTGSHSALRCSLHSGRTHQIRVHMAWRGHPLVGDAVYGGGPALGLTRQALHAVQLGFLHPISGQAMVFDCAPPADFLVAWHSVATTV